LVPVGAGAYMEQHRGLPPMRVQHRFTCECHSGQRHRAGEHFRDCNDRRAEARECTDQPEGQISEVFRRLPQLVQHDPMGQLAVCARLPRLPWLGRRCVLWPLLCELVPVGSKPFVAVRLFLRALWWAAGRGASRTVQRRLCKLVPVGPNALLAVHFWLLRLLLILMASFCY